MLPAQTLMMMTPSHQAGRINHQEEPYITTKQECLHTLSTYK